MSRRNRSSGVKGPSSALSEFLRNEGITDAYRERRLREEREQSQSASVEPEQEQSQTEEVGTSSTPDFQGVSPSPGASRRRTISISATPAEVIDEEEQEIIQAARKKRKLARRTRSGHPDNSDFDDSDDDDDDDFSLNGDDDDDELSSNFKKFGEEERCIDCDEIFNLSVYSRFEENKKGYLCEACNEKLKKRERLARRNELNARKKRKKVAQALLDKSEANNVPSLQDICIKRITLSIKDVEALGDIGIVNLNKISKILSKNRSLNDETMTLFLNPNLKSLEFWDCSNVDSTSLNKIASFCPNLESLTLYMCGNLHNDNLIYYKSKLTNLSEISLNGPFLISDIMWQDFFEGQNNITKFDIRNTHRFGNDSLISLLENCGSKLTLLKLSKLDGLDSEAVYDLIPHYLQTNTLTHLEISYPHKKDLISNEFLINIFAITGESLKSLNVDGCSELTDTFLIEGLSKFCPNLTSLSMKDVDLVSDEGFAQAFLEYPQVNSGGLINVDLTKCSGLGDKAVYALLLHSATTLVELSLNSNYNISKDFLLQIFTDDLHPSKVLIKEATESSNNSTQNINEEKEKRNFYSKINFPFLTRWDIGFVRAVDNEVLSYISNNCLKLRILEVYGDNKCTSKAKTRDNLMIIGRQHDTI